MDGVRPRRVALRTKELTVAVDKAAELQRTAGLSMNAGRLEGGADRLVVLCIFV